MAGIYATIALLVAAGDLGIKHYIEKNLKPNESRRILKGKVILRRTHNKGMMMNRMEKHPLFVRFASVSALGALIIWQAAVYRRPGRDIGKTVEKAGLAMMTGGAVSNTYDRIKRGYVVDYISFPSRLKKFARIAFNIGDFAIFAGGLMAALQTIYTVGREVTK